MQTIRTILASFSVLALFLMMGTTAYADTQSITTLDPATATPTAEASPLVTPDTSTATPTPDSALPTTGSSTLLFIGLILIAGTSFGLYHSLAKGTVKQ